MLTKADGIHVDMNHLKTGEVKYGEIILSHSCYNADTLYNSLGTSMWASTVPSTDIAALTLSNNVDLIRVL